MSISVSLTSKYSHLGDTITKAETLTGDSLMEVESAVDGSEDDLAIDFSLSDPTLVKGLYMVATTDMVVTPKNVATASATPIELFAGVALMWSQSSGLANPFDGANVAKLHVANLDSDAGAISIRCLKDGTPLTS